MKRSLCLIMLALAGCESGPGGPPPIARGVTLSSQDGRAWSGRLIERFPAGTSETDVAARLREEGFVIIPEANKADFYWSRFPCGHFLGAVWKAVDGKITTIEGTYGTACT